MDERPGIQPEEVFGCSLEDLNYEALRDLVEAHHGSEPLVWEAKGGELVEKRRTAPLRKAVSAFANSVDGGFVFVGVENDGTDRQVALKAVGARFPDDEPGRWVSNALDTYQLRPRPWFDVRQLVVPGDERRQIAVVWVPPIDAPPCIADGSVYERVVGVSTPVQDPTRLAALYQRGQDRRDAARSMADREHVRLSNEAVSIQVGTPGVYACVCVAPLQPSPGLRKRLFTRAAYDAVEQRLKTLGTYGTVPGGEIAVTHSQHALDGRVVRSHGNPLKALVRIGDEGYVAVATKGYGGSPFESLMWTWQLACELNSTIADVDRASEHYLAAMLSSQSGEVARVMRGPLLFPREGDPGRADLEREIERAAGRFGWDPDVAGGANST